MSLLAIRRSYTVVYTCRRVARLVYLLSILLELDVIVVVLRKKVLHRVLISQAVPALHLSVILQRRQVLIVYVPICVEAIVVGRCVHRVAMNTRQSKTVWVSQASLDNFERCVPFRIDRGSGLFLSC